MTDGALKPHRLVGDFAIDICGSWHPPETLIPQIEALWSKAAARPGTRLTNGELFVLIDHAPDRLVLARSEYRYAIARRVAPHLVMSGLNVRPVAITGIVRSQDGVLLGRRADWVATDAGLWEPFPSGGLDRPDPLEQLMVEFEEETGLGRAFIRDCRVCGLLEDPGTGLCDVVWLLDVDATADELRAALGKRGQGEHTDIRVVPADQLARFIADNEKHVVGALAPMLGMAGLSD